MAKTTTELGDDRFETMVALVVVLVLMVGASWWGYNRYYDAKHPVQDVKERVALPFGASPRVGADNASVTVVEFSDFECPYCAQFATQTYPLIKEQYIDTGKIRFVYKHFPLQTHEYAALAAIAASCAEQEGAFWEYHDLLYTYQDAFTADDLVDHAATAGIDVVVFRQCLSNQETLPFVENDKALGLNSGVTGTPTFFFNGRKVVGALSFADFSAEVDKELALVATPTAPVS